jgi:DNA (cytosine-5)-methyltransferase 1
MKIGSLCTGYGGLDLAVEEHFNARTVWCAEFDKNASKLIDMRFDIPNYGDIKSINWAEVEPIDILTAGYPCQPFSHAGYRKGSDDERHLWPYIKEIISHLRPSYVVLENVAGHLSLGFDQVLADLTEIGYDARWEIVRASDVGAPHQRKRLFVIAYPASQRCQDQLCTTETDGLIESFTTNSYCDAHSKPRRADRGISEPSDRLRDGQDQGKTRDEHRGSGTTTTNSDHAGGIRSVQGFPSRFNSRHEMSLQTAPNTLDQLGRLNPEFVEYMMGLPVGWVTDSGLARTQQLKMLGNGVVPQQAKYALELLTSTKWEDINED